MSGYNPYWRPQGFPVWKTRADVFRILDQYRKWYAEGLSDVEISARIRQLQLKHNPQSQFRRGRR